MLKYAPSYFEHSPDFQPGKLGGKDQYGRLVHKKFHGVMHEMKHEGKHKKMFSLLGSIAESMPAELLCW